MTRHRANGSGRKGAPPPLGNLGFSHPWHLGRGASRCATVTASLSLGLAALSLIDAGGLIAMLQAAAPAIGCLSLFAGAVLILRRWPRKGLATILGGFLLVAPMASTHSLVQHQRGDGGAVGETLTDLSNNPFAGASSSEELMDVIRRIEPDALVLIEATESHWRSLMYQGVYEYVPHVSGRVGPGGLVVASRSQHLCLELASGAKCGSIVPVDAVAIDRFGSETPSYDSAVVALADGTVLFGVHAWSMRMSPLSRWREQQEELVHWRWERRPPGAFIMAGDFNAGFSHPVFRRLAKDLAHAPSGEFPWPRTWTITPSFPAIIQIDHLLADGLLVVDSGVEPIARSDHAAVWATYTRIHE